MILTKLRLESQNLAGLFQRDHVEASERGLHGLEMSEDRVGALESLGLDVVREVPIEKVGHRQPSGRRWRPERRYAGITTRHDFTQKPRFPHPIGRLLRRDRFGGAPGDREIIDAHPPPLARMHHVEPPRVVASRTARAAFLLTDFPHSHVYAPLLARRRSRPSASATSHSRRR